MKEYGIINLQIKCIRVCLSVCHGISIQEGFDVRSTVLNIVVASCNSS